MPKGSPELTSARKEEIISACRKLYETMSFKDITLKEIGKQSELAHALERRPLMLKLLSMNLYDMEANSRMERLVEFKKAYGESSAAVDRCLKKFVPGLTEENRQTFLYAFLPFVYGLYPYTYVTEKQRDAMRQAGISYAYMSTCEMACSFIRTMLGGLL